MSVLLRRQVGGEQAGIAGDDLSMIDLGPGPLTLKEVEAVARYGAKVQVNSEAMERVEQGFRVAMEAMLQNKPVYGLTTGVGVNQDQPVFRTVQRSRMDCWNYRASLI